MVLIEKKTVELWGEPVANSAELLSAEGGKVRGLLIESDTGLRFRAAGEGESRFHAPWPSVTGVRSSFARPRRIDVLTEEGRHRLRLTDAVIDGPVIEGGADGSAEDSFPIEGGARRSDATREEVLLDDAATAVGALTVVVGYVAADRVRRRRVAERILERSEAD
jgi:hypothetical protein